MAFEAWLSLIFVRNVVGELQLKRTLAASRGFLAAARLSCLFISFIPLYFNTAALTAKYSEPATQTKT